MQEAIANLDNIILYAVQAVGSFWYYPAWFFSEVVVSTHWLAPALALALLLIGKRRVALELILIFIVATGFIVGTKQLVESPRPYWNDTQVVQYVVDEDFGMPSGHAVVSVVILGWLWWRHPKSIILSAAVPFFILMVGLSRVYLGLHYPSQVIAGWVLGALLLWLFLWLDRWYFRPRDTHHI
ncbi:MAG: phosphatase PAP2 family protein [bacterium]|nr:phosphatase PAP2 family protein [bacterium]